jgi:uncharacterized cupredoxin-like copper-binding protein
MKRSIFAPVLAAAVAFAGVAWSHDDTQKSTGQARAIAVEEHAFGRQGDPKRVSRTVRIEMADTMRYTPAQITVKRGETIRFETKNSGKVMHEIVFGTKKDLQAHAELMRKHPGMEHDEPYMAHVAPGETGGLVWQFTRPGEFYYACLVPGHFEAGMVGKVVVE